MNTFASVANGSLEDARSNGWVGSWAASPHGPLVEATLGVSFDVSNFTIRQIVRTTIGGEQIRVRFSNVFGAQPLLIDAAHIAVRRSAADTVPGTDRALTFDGAQDAEIPPGAFVFSDPLDFPLPPLCELAISTYSAASTNKTGVTYHLHSLQKCYVSPPTGNYCAVLNWPPGGILESWFLLTGVDMRPLEPSHAVVALGDCMTDGAESTPGANARWTDILAERFIAKNLNVSVLNAGLIGNRLLRDAPHPFETLFGPSALNRFDRDVLGQTGIECVIILEGNGDLTLPRSVDPDAGDVDAADLIGALAQLADRAQAKGVRVIGGTLTPFENGVHPEFGNLYSAETETKRQRVNEWIRSTKAFDGVIDFDRILRDPGRPTRLLSGYDAGDHIHLNDLGHRTIAEGIDLSLFS